MKKFLMVFFGATLGLFGAAECGTFKLVNRTSTTLLISFVRSGAMFGGNEYTVPSNKFIEMSDDMIVTIKSSDAKYTNILTGTTKSPSLFSSGYDITEKKDNCNFKLVISSGSGLKSADPY